MDECLVAGAGLALGDAGGTLDEAGVRDRSGRVRVVLDFCAASEMGDRVQAVRAEVEKAYWRIGDAQAVPLGYVDREDGLNATVPALSALLAPTGLATAARPTDEASGLRHIASDSPPSCAIAPLLKGVKVRWRWS